MGDTLIFDSESERFLDCEAGNKMMTRDYREGFEVPEIVWLDSALLVEVVGQSLVALQRMLVQIKINTDDLVAVASSIEIQHLVKTDSPGRRSREEETSCQPSAPAERKSNPSKAGASSIGDPTVP